MNIRIYPSYILLLLIVSFINHTPSILAAGGDPLKGGSSGHEGRWWAVCIGVGDYQDPDIIDLPSSRNDAKGLARVLSEHGGFDQVFLFADDLKKSNLLYPTRKNILSQMERLKNLIHPEDRILFSFSGHGMYDEAGHAYILPADARLRHLNETGVPINDVISFIQKIRVKGSILFLDASRERIARSGAGIQSGIYPDRYLREGVSAVFYASRKGVHSHDDEDSGYGVFARYLIRGLEGEADKTYGGNQDGIITLSELGSYVNEGIMTWSSSREMRQIPSVRILDIKILDMKIAETRIVAVAEEKVAKTETEKAPAAKPQEVVKEPSPSGAPVRAAQKAEEKVAQVKESKKDVVAVRPPAPKVEELMEKKGPEIPPEVDVQPRPETTAIVGDRKGGEGEIKGKDLQQSQDQEKTEPVEKGEMSTPQMEQEAVERPLDMKGDNRTREEVLVFSDERSKGEGEIFKKGEQLEMAGLPRDVEPKPVHLRDSPQDISPKDVGAMLIRYNFYATCWNSNGDFCHPNGEFENHFTEPKDGTVIDEATHLMWQKGGSPQPMTWVEAKDYVRKVNEAVFGGYSDWRLPTAEELASLMESSWKNLDLFIDPLFDRSQRYCWSADASGMSKAWKANFHLGFIVDFPMTSLSSVRLVRSIR